MKLLITFHAWNVSTLQNTENYNPSKNFLVRIFLYTPREKAKSGMLLFNKFSIRNRAWPDLLAVL